MTLRVKNWGEFQHYRDRKPSWIKLHKELLDNYEWHRLPDASRALAPMLWLLASESEDGTISGTVDKIAFRLHTTTEKIIEALKPLISAGFFIPCDDCSGVISEPEQGATSEEETQVETEVEEERETPTGVVAAATSPAEIDRAVQTFNEAAERVGWPKVQVVSKARKAGLRQRLKDCGGLEGWRIAIAKAEASDFLAGRAPPSPGHEGWRMDLDFLLMPKRFTKLMEGGYDNRAGPVPGKKEGAIEAMMRGAQSLIDSGFTPREL